MAYTYSPSGIEYAECDDSPKETWSETGLKATVELLTPWALRYALCEDIFGGNPLVYPPAPWSRAFAKEASCVPFGDGIPSADKKYNDYHKALVTVTFSFDSKGPQTTELISESLEPTAEFLTLDAKDLRWGSQGGDEMGDGDGPGVLLRGFNWVYTQHMVMNVPAAILTLASCCNAASVYARLLGLTFPAQTLLYQPPTLERKITVQQIEAWKITHRFSYKPNGWNKFWNPKTQSWSYVYHKDSSSPLIPYPPANFNPIFAVS